MLAFLKRLYERQQRSVLTDKESDVFETDKGRNRATRCPGHSRNRVSRIALKDDLAKWQRKGAGIRI